MQADFVLWGPGLGLRLLKNTILSTDPSCQKVPWAAYYFEPLPATLPEALWCFSFLLYEMKRRKWFYILPFCRSPQPRSWPSLSAPYFSSLAARTSAVWLWPALPKLYQIGRSFSFQIDILEKQKKDYDMIRPITRDVLRGRSNRNPSNILNGFCFSKCQDAV